MLKTITKKQITIIHVLKAELGMDDDMYRSLLSGYGVKSSTELSCQRAGKLITSLKMHSGNTKGDADAWKHKRTAKTTYKKYDHLSNGRGLGGKKATPAQLYVIQTLWKIGSKSGTEKSLMAMLIRIVKTEKPEWLDKKQASTMIVTLQDMAVKAIRKRWSVLTSQELDGNSETIDADLIRFFARFRADVLSVSPITSLMPKRGKNDKKKSKEGRVAGAGEIISIVKMIEEFEAKTKV